MLLSLRSRITESGHSIELTGDDSLDITSYPGAVAQIISNLVKNSKIQVFADGDEGRITIQISGGNDIGKISYRDSGRGMRKETLDHLFEPFYTTQRGRGGVGLGMHIGYNLVTQKLGGTIKCHSEPDWRTEYVIISQSW